MHIPDSVKKSIKKSPFENRYFKLHNDMRKSLNNVLSGKDTYSSYHYAMLINDFEICLKGFLTAKKEQGVWKLPHPTFLTDHKLAKLVKEVQSISPLFACKDGKEQDELFRFMGKLRSMYTKARYEKLVPFSEFVQLNKDFVQPTINRMYEILQEDIEMKNEDLEQGIEKND